MSRRSARLQRKCLPDKLSESDIFSTPAKRSGKNKNDDKIECDKVGLEVIKLLQPIDETNDLQHQNSSEQIAIDSYDTNGAAHNDIELHSNLVLEAPELLEPINNTNELQDANNCEACNDCSDDTKDLVDDDDEKETPYLKLDLFPIENETTISDNESDVILNKQVSTGGICHAPLYTVDSRKSLVSAAVKSTGRTRDGSSDEDLSSDDGFSSDDDDSDMEAFADSFADDLIAKLSSSSPLTSQPKFKSSKYLNSDLPHHGSSSSKDCSKLPPTEIDAGFDFTDTYISVDESNLLDGNKKILNLYSSLSTDKDSIFQHSVIKEDFEAKHSVPCEMSKRTLVKQRRKERKESSGKNWFDMKAPEMTDEVKRDLKVLQMRSVLDPKRFYKHNDRKALPKYFQVGKIMDNAADFYSSRVPKKQRKSNLVDELLADAKFKKFQKRKYNEIQAKRKALAGNRHFRKRNKFSKKNSAA